MLPTFNRKSGADMYGLFLYQSSFFPYNKRSHTIPKTTLMKRRLLIINLFALALTIAVFTPFLTPKDVYRPMLFGLPYTLWMGVLVTIVFVILTWQAARAYKKVEEEEQA